MYYNILSELKNAVRAKKDKVIFPFSKMDFAVAKTLADNGYLKSVEKEMIGRKSAIVAKISYKEKDNVLNDFKLVSKPSRHYYSDYRSLKSVKQGHGMGVLSTSKGIMTTREAKKQKIGGEYLFEIW